ncbi:MAG TPA: LysR family transcriptional regulator, partial [Reyranella sp.]|nr:LysR family transcriptional regulator [Reyranella sp.]
LAASDLLATLPAPAMAGTLRPFGLESRRVPFAIDPIPHVMLWSAGRSQDPEIAWLRHRLRPLARNRFTSLAG